MQWLVAKYVRDLRRRETQNVGVILYTEKGAFSRFLGQRDAKIDGRYTRWTRSLDTYKAFVDLWQRTSTTVPSASGLLAEYPPRSDDSYFLEEGGERLVSTEAADPESVLDDLYALLVEQPAPETLSVAHLAETVLNRLSLGPELKRKVKFNVAGDEILFDYRYDNGAPNLMQRVSLSLGDDRSWSNVYAASLTFEKAESHEMLASLGKRPQRIALIKLREEDENLAKQLKMLEHHTDLVVDVGVESEATQRLSSALHLAQPDP